MNRALRACFLAALVPLVATNGCQAVLGIELLEETPTPSPPGSDASVDQQVPESGEDTPTAETLFDSPEEIADSSTESAPDSDSAVSCALACPDTTLARPPCPPSVADTGDKKHFVFAARAVRAGLDRNKPNDWMNLGYDLDCMATGQTGVPTPCVQETATDDASVPALADALEGRDNSLGRNIGMQVRFLETMNLIPNVEEVNRDTVEKGQRGLLFVIDDYNGEADDPAIKFAILTSRGVVCPPQDAGDNDADSNEDAACTSEVGPDEGGVAAKWDGKDLWSVDKDCLYQGTGEPRYYTDNAYVIDHRLVARFSTYVEIKFTDANSTLSLVLSSAILSVKIEGDKLTDGVLAGVWKTTDAMEAVGRYVQLQNVCPSDSKYDLLMEGIKGSSDLRADAVYGPGKFCDAVSIGIGFEGYKALRGPDLDPPTIPQNPCDG